MDHSTPEDNQPEPTRPDWLVGADQGAAAESARPAAGAPSSPVRLVRPQAEPPERSSASSDFGALDLSGGPAPGVPGTLPLSSLRRAAPAPDPNAMEKKKAWTAAASSVPRLRLVKSPAAATPQAPFHDDESPRRATARETLAPDDDAFLEDASSSPAEPARTSRGNSGARPGATLKESWWVVAVDALRSDRRIQLGLGALAAVAIAASLLQPREDARTSLATIRRNPDRFDARLVTVEGRVGEVFAVGGGYAFYLHQGRDTLVVFTRARRPESRTKVRVKGSISTGFLDGLPRQALFEAL